MTTEGFSRQRLIDRSPQFRASKSSWCSSLQSREKWTASGATDGSLCCKSWDEEMLAQYQRRGRERSNAEVHGENPQ